MIEKVVATTAYALIVSGVLMRKNRRIHPILMGCGIGLDLLLVLYLQVQRGVIQEAITQDFSLLQRGHILASTLAVVMYFPTVALGISRVMGRSDPAGRKWHIRCALTAFAFRSVGFVLMFTI